MLCVSRQSKLVVLIEQDGAALALTSLLRVISGRSLASA
jgi:hypothetical protein